MLRAFQREQLIFAVRRALEHRRLKIEILYLKNVWEWEAASSFR
jgi:hypothetical protein